MYGGGGGEGGDIWEKGGDWSMDAHYGYGEGEIPDGDRYAFGGDEAAGMGYGDGGGEGYGAWREDAGWGGEEET